MYNNNNYNNYGRSNGGGRYNNGGGYNGGGGYNNGGGYGGRSYGGGGGRYNNGGGFGGNNGGQPKKHSGATSGVDKNDNPYVRGWKYDKRNGLRSFLACPYKGTKEVTSRTGRVWHNWMVKVTPQGQQSFIVSGLYDPQTKVVIIPELGFTMNPKGGRGGYTGPFYTRG